eukprot:SAG31_NODE_28304_length_412_cov_0.651757_1_plen_46_part_01
MPGTYDTRIRDSIFKNLVCIIRHFNNSKVLYGLLVERCARERTHMN